MKVILDKTGRVVDGVNHGRKVTTDGEYFYKTFDKDIVDEIILLEPMKLDSLMR